MEPDFEKTELIPAIVQDINSREVLMLAYVNKESYEYMKVNKQTCFYSRSRNKLWHKGETSGHFQNIKGMYLDCDRDTLLIFVEQIGTACHTGSYSCFFNEVMPFKKEIFDENILQIVYSQIEDRDKNPIEKSYTNYLLNCGVDKICKKIGEESTETVIAAKNKDKKELIGEISDLVYHVLVLMYDSGIKLEDVKNKMEERHKKSGNKKEEHIKGEY